MIGAFISFTVGSALAIIVGFFAAIVGFDREKGFPTLLMVIAAYYVLFGAMAADSATIAGELTGFLLFGAAAVIGFRSNPWVIVAGLCAHGLFDLVHGLLFTNPGAPAWWADFCLGFDFTIAAWLGWILIRSGRAGTPERRRQCPLYGVRYPATNVSIGRKPGSQAAATSVPLFRRSTSASRSTSWSSA